MAWCSATPTNWQHNLKYALISFEVSTVLTECVNTEPAYWIPKLAGVGLSTTVSETGYAYRAQPHRIPKSTLPRLTEREGRRRELAGAFCRHRRVGVELLDAELGAGDDAFGAQRRSNAGVVDKIGLHSFACGIHGLQSGRDTATLWIVVAFSCRQYSRSWSRCARGPCIPSARFR